MNFITICLYDVSAKQLKSSSAESIAYIGMYIIISYLSCSHIAINLTNADLIIQQNRCYNIPDAQTISKI